MERVAEHEARIAQLIAEMQALLDEQHRIVAHLDRLQVKAEAIRAAWRGRLRASCSGRANDPMTALRETNMATAVQLTSVLRCPQCGFEKEETMPTDACQFFYQCTHCGVRLRPKPGDCCVFCSYGSRPCPSKQAEHAERRAGV